ncbi:MAG: hypothetical protein ABF537_05495 [Acetobacter sp.]|uniref:hypothetical protein n=1 Tax=Acetobacter sp. TaxID=440 RepID=UPI0039EB2667
MTTIKQYLTDHGPARSSLIVEALVASGAKPEAARQRIARVEKPIRRFPVPMLPKREAFLYLEKDRNGERFWQNFMRDMRATNSVFAASVDSMIARGGLIPADRFAAISGATVIPQKGQLPVEIVAQRLIAADFMKEIFDADAGRYFQLPPSLAIGSQAGLRARDLTERVLLDGMREWCRKIGLASYNAIRIRGDNDLKPIGPFAFDFAGPSYLLPLQGPKAKPGFVVADVFAEGILTVNEIQFFIRKARILKSTLKDIGVLSIIVAEGFTGEAMTAGHAAGIMLATPKDLFGKRVGAAIPSLCEVMKNAAKYASSSPERLTQLLDNLFDIEGRNLNLRGALFELVVGYLARRSAASIDMNIIAKDPTSGNAAEIDVQAITHHTSAVTAIECKGKEPGGRLTLLEVETWLKKITIIRAHYGAHHTLREAEHRFEIWTSGTIDADAVALLEKEKARRIKAPIDWKDGEAVLALARAGKEKGIADALNQHFFKHPFAEVAKKIETENPPDFLSSGFRMPSLTPPIPPTKAPPAFSALPPPSSKTSEISLADE